MCEFCELYKSVREINDPNLEDLKARGKPVRVSYHACLIQKDYREWNDTWGGSVTYEAMPLNFCPVCGRDMRKEQPE